jgi:hypothetical protein
MGKDYYKEENSQGAPQQKKLTLELQSELSMFYTLDNYTTKKATVKLFSCFLIGFTFILLRNRVNQFINLAKLASHALAGFNLTDLLHIQADSLLFIRISV